MPPTPRRHKLIIEAIHGLRDRAFSGWEVARLTGVPRSSITRVMGHLLQMGLLVYGVHNQYDRWVVTNLWPLDLEELSDRYIYWLRTRARRTPDS